MCGLLTNKEETDRLPSRLFERVVLRKGQIVVSGDGAMFEEILSLEKLMSFQNQTR